MTEAEADALDEYYTQNPPIVKPGQKGGFFTEHAGNIVVVDDLSAAYIRSRADGVRTVADDPQNPGRNHRRAGA
jgi:hypothetical protein